MDYPSKERREYFYLRDKLYATGVTGLSRSSIHHMLMNNLFKKLVDEEEVFNLEDPYLERVLLLEQGEHELSTRWLTQKGWQIYIELVKEFINDNYKIIL